MPRDTENEILQAMVGGHVVPARQLNHLLEKVSRDQSKKRARRITAGTELDFVAFYNTLTAGEQAIVRTGMSNYVNDSSQINQYLRTGAPLNAAANAATVDAMFGVYINHGQDQTRRITYRLQTYRPTGNPPLPPYRTAVPPAGGGGIVPAHIVVGDLITDTAFWSTSENRQLLVSGIQNPPAGTRYAKFVIIGVGGINIAGHWAIGTAGYTGASYSNTNEAAIDSARRPGESDLALAMRLRFKSRPAGQAEILFNRGMVYQVEAIEPRGNDINVRLSVPMPQPGVGGAKNAFTGV